MSCASGVLLVVLLLSSQFLAHPTKSVVGSNQNINDI